MAETEDRTDPQRIQFVKGSGSTITVGSRDRAERIREAIVDLKIAIGGCAAQPADRLSDTVVSLARHSSIFLRKMVLGDDRNPRLLDAEFCQKAKLRFKRIRKVQGNRRSFTLVPVDVTRGYFQVTKLDEETEEPEAIHVIPLGPQRLCFVIDWPLSGMTDWINQPTEETPWAIRPSGLFDAKSGQGLNCDEWLGQQLVMFDDRGITLNDVIRVTANTEAAHSPPLERLWLSEGNEDKARFRVVKDREIHILSHILICGVRYSHAIVIQAAMDLYQALAQDISDLLPKEDVGIPVFCFIPDDVFSPDQAWLRFDGGLAISLGGIGQSVTHRVRAPK